MEAAGLNVWRDKTRLVKVDDWSREINFTNNQPDIPQLIERIERLSNNFYQRYDYTVLPENSYIPFNPNPHFTGRNTDLLELYLKMIGNLNKIGMGFNNNCN